MEGSWSLSITIREVGVQGLVDASKVSNHKNLGILTLDLVPNDICWMKPVSQSCNSKRFARQSTVNVKHASWS